MTKLSYCITQMKIYSSTKMDKFFEFIDPKSSKQIDKDHRDGEGEGNDNMSFSGKLKGDQGEEGEWVLGSKAWGAGRFKVGEEGELEECQRQHTVTFDKWVSAREQKGELISTDKEWGETNTDVNPLLVMTTQANTCVGPSSRPTIAPDTGWAITLALWVWLHTHPYLLRSPLVHPSASNTDAILW